jgi:hypothetical protein
MYPGLQGISVEKFVEYLAERPEESSFLYLVNMNPILISGVTLYLSVNKPMVHWPRLCHAHHFFMGGLKQGFPQSNMNTR